MLLNGGSFESTRYPPADSVRAMTPNPTNASLPHHYGFGLIASPDDTEFVHGGVASLGQREVA